MATTTWVRLSFEERLEIARAVKKGWSVREIAAGLGRAPSSVSRELARNRGRAGYHAWFAQHRWKQTRCRPKPFRLESHGRLARAVERGLRKRWSPDQIARRLRRDHPDDPRWWVSPETIYRSLFVQGRGGLARELTGALRRGRISRRGHVPDDGRGRFPDMVMISERPAEVEDRAVPGHWEGDLLVGSGPGDEIATLVERATRYVLLCALPNGHRAPVVRDALAKTIRRLPAELRHSLTWDQGKEMAQHAQLRVDAGIDVYFCDPRSPWQRGTNENTNGLLRQYFPKGTPIKQITQRELNRVARELNGRPRKTLDYETPAEAYARTVAMTT
jgi:IS30 family transposase